MSVKQFSTVALIFVLATSSASADSHDDLRCELALMATSGVSQRNHQNGLEWAKGVIRSGSTPGYVVQMKGPFVDRELPVMVPNRESLQKADFQHLLDNTVGITWRDTTGVGEQLGHAYIRVGNRIYDMQVAETFAASFREMMDKRFKYDFGARDRPGRAPYYEVVFPISESAKEEMIRFYEDRTKGIATIDGIPNAPRWVLGTKGERNHEGRICEDCGAFANAFAHPQWWKDYPLLRQATKDTGLIERKNLDKAGLNALFDPHANALALISWGGARSDAEISSQHEILRRTGWDHEIGKPTGYGLPGN